MPARGQWLTRRGDASVPCRVAGSGDGEIGQQREVAGDVRPNRRSDTPLRIARTPGISTCGVTDRRGFRSKLTAAAASAGEPGVGADAPPICPNDSVTGVVPIVVNVNPRKGDSAPSGQGAGAEDSRQRLVAEPGCHRSLADVGDRQLHDQRFQADVAAVINHGQEGSARRRSVAAWV